MRFKRMNSLLRQKTQAKFNLRQKARVLFLTNLDVELIFWHNN